MRNVNTTEIRAHVTARQMIDGLSALVLGCGDKDDYVLLGRYFAADECDTLRKIACRIDAMILAAKDAE